MKYYNRDIKNLFLEYTKNFKTVLVTGPRQVGKTTMLKELKDKKRKYVTLDDIELRVLANNNPKEFINMYSPPVIIDEIQYAPNLLSYIKIYCDTTDKRNLFWLTGSQKIQIMKGVSETLVGRMGVLEMTPLTEREIHSSKFLPMDVNELIPSNYIDKNEVINKIFNGSMPDVIFHNVDRNFYYKSYINLYLDRDIRELKDVQDLETFRSFMAIVASKCGLLVNYNNISKEAGISDKTAKTWLSILENTGIISFVYQYKKDEFKRLKTHPKMIFMDSGLAVFLLGINSLTALKKYTFLGNLYENYVISEIIKNNNNFNLEYQFSYYRDKNGNEVDLIITDRDNILHLFEIKMNDKVDIKMINGFKVFKDVKNVGSGGIICTSKVMDALDNDNKVIPISAIIS